MQMRGGVPQVSSAYMAVIQSLQDSRGWTDDALQLQIETYSSRGMGGVSEMWSAFVTTERFAYTGGLAAGVAIQDEPDLSLLSMWRSVRQCLYEMVMTSSTWWWNCPAADQSGWLMPWNLVQTTLVSHISHRLQQMLPVILWTRYTESAFTERSKKINERLDDLSKQYVETLSAQFTAVKSPPPQQLQQQQQQVPESRDQFGLDLDDIPVLPPMPTFAVGSSDPLSWSPPIQQPQYATQQSFTIPPPPQVSQTPPINMYQSQMEVQQSLPTQQQQAQPVGQPINPHFAGFPSPAALVQETPQGDAPLRTTIVMNGTRSSRH